MVEYFVKNSPANFKFSRDRKICDLDGDSDVALSLFESAVDQIRIALVELAVALFGLRDQFQILEMINSMNQLNR